MKEIILMFRKLGFTNETISEFIKPFAEYWYKKGQESVKCVREEKEFDHDDQFKYHIPFESTKGDYHEGMDDYVTNKW